MAKAMHSIELFDLYKLVQNGDGGAQDELLKRHKEKYPRHAVHKLHKREWVDAKQTHHMMYMHLSK